MKGANRVCLLGATACLVVLLSATTHFTAGQQAIDLQKGWKESKDPCYPVKQEKKFVKESYGMDMPYMTCVPLRVTLDWTVEVEYHRHPPFGNDQMHLFVRERYPAYMKLVYNQQKRDVLDSFLILSAAPCCPGEAISDIVQAQAAFWACDGSSIRDCVRVTTSNPMDFELIPREGDSLAFKWSRDGLSRQGEAFTPKIKYLDKPPKTMLEGILWNSTFSLRVQGDESLTWDEVRQGMEDESLYKVFPLREHTVFPSPRGNLDHTYSLKGKAELYISFGETKEEIWTVTLEGRERDETGPPITCKNPDKSTQTLPIAVQFDWLAQGRVTLRKAKKARFYDSGTITKFSQSPEIVFGHPDLYRCELTFCQGIKAAETMSIYEQSPLAGEVQGDSLRLAWPAYPSQACVVCSPRKEYLGKVPYRHEFGGGDAFLKRMAEVWMPLMDGSVKAGTTPEAVDYKITLKKVK
jgi:hypothetical protein